MKSEIFRSILLFLLIIQLGYAAEGKSHEFKPNQIIILGWVKEPQTYTINEKESLISCLLKAGGVLSEASLRKIIIKKRVHENGKLKYVDYRVDLKALVEDSIADVKESIFWISEGDVIYVPSGCLFPSKE